MPQTLKVLDFQQVSQKERKVAMDTFGSEDEYATSTAFKEMVTRQLELVGQNDPTAARKMKEQAFGIAKAAEEAAAADEAKAKEQGKLELQAKYVDQGEGAALKLDQKDI